MLRLSIHTLQLLIQAACVRLPLLTYTSFESLASDHSYLSLHIAIKHWQQNHILIDSLFYFSLLAKFILHFSELCKLVFLSLNIHFALEVGHVLVHFLCLFFLSGGWSFSKVWVKNLVANIDDIFNLAKRFRKIFSFVRRSLNLVTFMHKCFLLVNLLNLLLFHKCFLWRWVKRVRNHVSTLRYLIRLQVRLKSMLATYWLHIGTTIYVV